MANAAKRLEREIENLTARSSARVRDETDAAGIELGGAVVESFGSRHQTGAPRESKGLPPNLCGSSVSIDHYSDTEA